MRNVIRVFLALMLWLGTAQGGAVWAQAPADSVSQASAGAAAPTDTSKAKKPRRTLKERLASIGLGKKKPDTPVASKTDTVAAQQATEAMAPGEAKAVVALDSLTGAYEQSLARGDYAAALRLAQLYQATKDSLVASELQASEAELARIEAEASARAAQQEASLAQERSARAEERTRAQTRFLIGVSAALLLLLLLAGFLVVNIRQRRAVNRKLRVVNTDLEQALEEVRTQQENLRDAYSIIETKNRDLTDSLQYARRIQEAILPQGLTLAKQFPQHMVLYQPRDIVSGDFYWLECQEHWTYLAAIDCTGHGVPGAFMSALSYALLEQIVTEEQGLFPEEILARLHRGIVERLNQRRDGGRKPSSLDGLDAAMLAISKDRTTVRYAGAGNAMYLLRGGQLTEFKPDKQSVGGGYADNLTFRGHQVATQPGDRIFLFSDGLADQFGGPDGRKFTYKRLRDLLSQSARMPLKQFAQQLQAELEEWKGHQEQVDDILVLGIEVEPLQSSAPGHMEASVLEVKL